MGFNSLIFHGRRGTSFMEMLSFLAGIGEVF